MPRAWLSRLELVVVFVCSHQSEGRLRELASRLPRQRVSTRWCVVAGSPPFSTATGVAAKKPLWLGLSLLPFLRPPLLVEPLAVEPPTLHPLGPLSLFTRMFT